MNEDEKLVLLEVGNQVIKEPEKNLRSKIQSIVRSLQALEDKKLRIEFEIKQQKKSLTRKREEFKRISKRNQAKLRIELENRNLDESLVHEELEALRILDQKLLLESYQALDN